MPTFACIPHLFHMPDSLNSPTLRSWIDIAPTNDFPIQNLPFGVFETDERGPRDRKSVV